MRKAFTWALFGLVMLWPLTRFASMWGTWLNYPYPRPGSEGIALYELLHWKRSGDVYAPITPELFISGAYPPLFYWLGSQLLPASLPDFSDPETVSSVFTSGRVISLLSAVGAAAILPLLVLFDGRYHRSGRRPLWLALAGGGLGGVLFLYMPQVLVWATRFQGEMPALALTAVGLLCIAAGTRNAKRETYSVLSPPLALAGAKRKASVLLLLSVVFFALSFFLKMSLAGPLAAAAFLLLRAWKVGLLWSTLMALAIVVPFIMLDQATGHWFYRHMLEYHPLLLRREQVWEIARALWEDQWPLVLLAAGYVLYRLSQLWAEVRVRTTPDVPVLIPFFALASFASLPLGITLEQGHSQLLLPGLAMCTCVGAGAARLLAGNRQEAGGSSEPVAAAIERHEAAVERHEPSEEVVGWKWTEAAALRIAIVLLALYALFTSWPSAWYNYSLEPLNQPSQEQMRKIVHNTSANPGSIFYSDEPGILALAGKETPFTNPYSMVAMAQRGRWDESAFRRMLREQQFGLLVLSCDAIEAADNCSPSRFTPGVIDAIRDGYEILFYDVFSTYVPK